MPDADLALIQKMIVDMDSIFGFIDSLSYEKFIDDHINVPACAFLVGHIGNLAQRLSQETLNSTNMPWDTIRAMHDSVIYDYENLDIPMFWEYISKSLPELKIQLQDIYQ